MKAGGHTQSTGVDEGPTTVVDVCAVVWRATGRISASLNAPRLAATLPIHRRRLELEIGFFC